MKSLFKTTLGITALVACSFSLNGAPDSINAAYRKDADVAGYFDLAAMHNSPLNQLFSEQVTDPTWDAIRKSLNVEDGDLKEVAFSASKLDGASGDTNESQLSGVLRITKPITLDQIEAVIKEQNAQNADEALQYEKRTIDGVSALVLKGDDGEDTVAIASFVKGNETLLAFATPAVLADIANNRNAGKLPDFAKEASAKLSEKGQGFATLKLTEKMKAGLKEGLADQSGPDSAMGFPIPPELVQNLHHIEFATLGVSLTDKALIELQGIFPQTTQATAVSNGLAGLLPIAQMMAGFAMAGNEAGPPPVTPNFAQTTKDNTTSFKLTLTPNAQK